MECIDFRVMLKCSRLSFFAGFCQTTYHEAYEPSQLVRNDHMLGNADLTTLILNTAGL
jgi:hypothetical protein